LVTPANFFALTLSSLSSSSSAFLIIVLSASILTSVPYPNPRAILSFEEPLTLVVVPNFRSLSLFAEDPLAPSPLISVSREPDLYLPAPNLRSSLLAEEPLVVLAPLSASSVFSLALPGLAAVVVAPSLVALAGVVTLSILGLVESLALVAAPAPPIEALVVVSPNFEVAPNLDIVPLVVSSPPFSANFAFSSSFAFTAFYFSRSFYFLSSVAVFVAADAAVGLINLDGALSPPAPPSDAPSLSLLASGGTIPLASSAAFFSASLRACLSIRVNLGFWGDTFESFDTSAEEVVDLVEDMTLYLLDFGSSRVVLDLGSRAISFFSSTFSLSI
jgi:hypothetical protein